jgi:DNA-binding NtrC family response regulator
MNLVAQAKLLRVLEGGAVERLGGHRAQRFDVRFVAATNQDLETLVAQRVFRSDLYYRLNIARVRLPPLRERAEDIPLLLAHYIALLNEALGAHVQGFSDDALDCLTSYTWPGNVRELRNLVESVLVARPTGTIVLEHLPDYCRAVGEPEGLNDERQRMLTALSTTNWNVSKAAHSLRWSRMTLYRKLKKHRIHRPGDAAVASISAL